MIVIMVIGICKSLSYLDYHRNDNESFEYNDILKVCSTESNLLNVSITPNMSTTCLINKLYVTICLTRLMIITLMIRF